MILKKPYKFFIKHFKIIHILLAIASGYLLIRTNSILSFFNEYTKSIMSYAGTNISSELFHNSMFILLFLIILGITVIALLMKWKEKPILLYLINLIIYAFVWIIYIYTHSIIRSLELGVLDVRTIKLASDLILSCFLVQTISVLFLTIRGLGFDIKKFNFNKDEDLKISSKDNEEFEFEVNVDSNKIKRNIKKNIRNINYIYKENKFLINIISVVAIAMIGIFVYLNTNVFNKIYKENKVINTTQYSMSILDSYMIDTDYRNNKITDNKLIVIKYKIKNNTNKELELDIDKFNLKINKSIFNANLKYNSKIIDLGKVYSKGKISNKFEEYLLVFEIPTNYSNKKTILNYHDMNDQKISIRIKPDKIKAAKEVKNTGLNNELKIDTEILKNITFKITDYQINNVIKTTYDFCETKEKCYKSNEYIVPSLSDNYDKAILKLENTINFNNQEIKNFNSLADFITRYGSFKYTINNEEKMMNTVIKEVKPLKSNYKNISYFEVYKEMKDATKITLLLNIRGQKYEYILK